MTTTKIHTRQLQQYTHDNYNNTGKQTTTIHTRQLQQHTQDNNNNTHGLQQYTYNYFENTECPALLLTVTNNSTKISFFFEIFIDRRTDTCWKILGSNSGRDENLSSSPKLAD